MGKYLFRDGPTKLRKSKFYRIMALAVYMTTHIARVDAKLEIIVSICSKDTEPKTSTGLQEYPFMCSATYALLAFFLTQD